MSLLTPVRYPVKYYSWEDADAPPLSNGDGVIKTILKACLITGYGSKEGAGWTLLEEDGDMMVIRRPLSISNPPDIRIENGQVGTENKHRIIAKDATGELVAVNMLARDNYAGKKWYMIVCDFGFLLCYQMGINHISVSSQHIKQAVIYVGSMSKMRAGDHDFFIIGAQNNVSRDGRISYQDTHPIISKDFTLINVATKTNIAQKHIVRFDYVSVIETHVGAYVAQPIWVGNFGKMPFYTALFSPSFDQLDINNQSIQIAGRPFLRYVNMPGYYYNGHNVLYIPLDYWEL